MQAYKKNFWIFLFLSFFLVSAEAAVDAALYQAEVPVASYSPEDFQKALGPALKQTLIKVSGNPQIAQSPVVRKAMTKANGMVQTFSYTTGEGQKPLMLQVHFSSKAVDDLLQNANPSHSAAVTATETTTSSQTTTATANADTQSVNMVISGVKGLQDFTALLDYLRHLEGVVDVSNKQTRGDRVLLIVKMNKTMEALAELISHDNKLIKESAKGGANPAAKVLRYRWVAAPAVAATPAPAAPAPAEPTTAAQPQPAVTSPAAPAPQPVQQPPQAAPAQPASPPSPPQTPGGAPIVEGVPTSSSNAASDAGDSTTGQAQSFGVPSSENGGFVPEESTPK